MNIKPGYALSITSWENDADFYKTQTFYGLTTIDVEFLLAISKLFKCYHNYDPENCELSGGSWHWPKGVDAWVTAVANAVDEVVAQFKDKGVAPELYAKWCIDRSKIIRDDVDDHEEVYDIALFETYNEPIRELVGMPETDMYLEEPYIRVFSGFEVHYYPAEVLDVTAQFQ